MSDAPPEACQVCGESPVTKVLYPAAIHFKGSGFYSTDYGKGSRRQGAKESGDGPPDAAAKKPEDAKPSQAEPKKAAEA